MFETSYKNSQASFSLASLLQNSKSRVRDEKVYANWFINRTDEDFILLYFCRTVTEIIKMMAYVECKESKSLYFCNQQEENGK